MTNPTAFDPKSWLNTVWDALLVWQDVHRDSGKTEEWDDASYARQWDDICTAMAWISEELGVDPSEL